MGQEGGGIIGGNYWKGTEIPPLLPSCQHVTDTMTGIQSWSLVGIFRDTTLAKLVQS